MTSHSFSSSFKSCHDIIITLIWEKSVKSLVGKLLSVSISKNKIALRNGDNKLFIAVLYRLSLCF